MVLVTFEGMDGSGKTTLIQAVQKHFQSGCCTGTDGQLIVAQMSKAPSWGDLRQVEVNQMPPARAAAEFFRDMRDMQSLWREHVILQDRWAESTIVYQAMISPIAEHDRLIADVAIDVDSIVQAAMSLMSPDLTIYLQCDPEIAQKRIQKRDGANNADIERLQMIGDGYNELYDLSDSHVMTSMSRTIATEYQYIIASGIYGQDVVVFPADGDQTRQAGIITHLIQQKIWKKGETYAVRN